jgi:hypothetical protein
MNRQHYKTDNKSDRAEAALGFVLAICIGVSIAWFLVQWWSS